MLKGKTIIELTNVKTGEVERVEDDNMVTNALNHIFEPFGHYKKPDKLFTDTNNIVPFYQNLLGGLLLFDGEITEDAEQLFAPSSVNLTACGVYGRQNDTTNTCRGDYNMTESEVNLSSKYVKFVYDFGTSQGNGNIACVALTSKRAGYCGYGAKDATCVNSDYVAFIPSDNVINFMGQSNCSRRGYSGTVGVTQYLFAVDPENDILWYLRVNSAKSISIVKRKGYFKTVGMFDTPSSSGRLIETIDLPDLSTGLYGTSYVYYNYIDSEKCLYMYSSSNSYLNAGGTFNIVKINIANNSVTEYPMTNQTNKTIVMPGDSTFVYGGYVYVRSYDSPYKIYKIAVGNSADVTEIPFPANAQNSYLTPSFAAAGRIFYEPYSHNYLYDSDRLCVLNTETEEMLMTESRWTYGGMYQNSPCGVPVIGHPECVWEYGYVIYPGIYLATINNIEPVTKTADKTMKVTYIIREHEE
jgi:hypothetical protein